jgi:MerR family copper efflux transcriptional regulator
MIDILLVSTNNLSKGRAMKLRELTHLTGVAERQVRYLIAEGFVPAPHGGRSNADYGEEHVAAIRRYAKLRDLGFPPAAIKLLMGAREGAPFPVAPGITLVVDPNVLGSGADVGPLAGRITALLTDLLREPTHDPDRAADKS